MPLVDDEPFYPMAIAFELFEAGCQMRAQRHRREHPEATDSEVEAVVNAWISERPGAEFGDAEGIPVTLPRVR